MGAVRKSAVMVKFRFRKIDLFSFLSLSLSFSRLSFFSLLLLFSNI